MFTLRKLTLALALTGLLSTPVLAETTVLASLPITFGLSELLLKDSGVKLQRAAPANLPGIAVQPGVHVDGLNSQPWLTSNNMGRMADVIAADLVRLAPDAKPAIETNLASLKQRLLKLSAESESRLAKADNLSVVSVSDRLDYLISGLNLERVDVAHNSEDPWTPQALKALTQTLKDNDVALVLDHREPSPELKAAITEGGSHLVVIGADGADPVAQLQSNIDAIVKTL